MIEPDYGLLDELLGQDTLSHDQYSLIRCRTVRPTVQQRNDQLLHYMTDDDVKSTALIAALQNTDQQHVVNFIQHHAGKLTESFTVMTL